MVTEREIEMYQEGDRQCTIGDSDIVLYGHIGMYIEGGGSRLIPPLWRGKPGYPLVGLASITHSNQTHSK